MCERHTSRPHPVPRWGRLYGLVLAAAAAAALTRATLQASPLRAAVLVAIPVLTGVAVTWWISTSGPALDLAPWCDCARSTLTVRVVMSAPTPSPPPPVSPRACPREPAVRTTLQG